MNAHFAYDLRIQTELPLPELESGEADPDVTITLGRVSPPPAEAEGWGFWAAPGEARYFFEGVGAFLIREGRAIVVDPAPGAEPGRLRLSILGPVLGILLHQRGHLVLHASSVAVNGGAVVFAGGRGWGKSTLAAAMYARGHSVIADDVTAVDVGAAAPAILPGFPQLKLWPDAVPSLGDSPEVQPRFHPLLDKRGFRVARGFPRRSVPLERVYVLCDGPTPTIEPLRPNEALWELVRHWYGGRFGDRLLRFENAAAAHLQQFSSLATSVAVRRLRYPGGASVLARIGLVEADLKS